MAAVGIEVTGACGVDDGMKSNFHTHSNWCDGRDTPEAMAHAAIERGFDVLGFSSHAMLPLHEMDWTLSAETVPQYVAAIRELAESLAPRLRILCGIEADYVAGGSTPDRGNFSAVGLDYIIGSVHAVVAPDGEMVPVDKTPEDLEDGIRRHFGGSAESFVRAYFGQQRDMAVNFDFDVIGHPDLVRKFNAGNPYFDENDAWYREELALTAEAFAESGKLVEVNTGAISRGWMDDAYPSAEFRRLLRERGVRFILSSDAHSADSIDCAFDRFAKAEHFETVPSGKYRKVRS